MQTRGNKVGLYSDCLLGVVLGGILGAAAMALFGYYYLPHTTSGMEPLFQQFCPVAGLLGAVVGGWLAYHMHRRGPGKPHGDTDG
jgi:hypothetical protein